MFTLRDFKSPETLDEAYELLMKSKMNKILGGCHFLKAGSRSYNVGIDLSKLDLNYINVEDDEIKIGATTTYRDLEYNDFLKEFCDGIIPKSLKTSTIFKVSSIVRISSWFKCCIPSSGIQYLHLKLHLSVTEILK